MHLDRRNGHRLESVENGNAGVGISGGIYDDSVGISVSRLDFIDYVALVIRLKKFCFHACFSGFLLQSLAYIGVAFSTVNIFLPNTDKVYIRAVDYKNFHLSESFSSFIADSTRSAVTSGSSETFTA